MRKTIEDSMHGSNLWQVSFVDLQWQDVKVAALTIEQAARMAEVIAKALQTDVRSIYYAGEVFVQGVGDEQTAASGTGSTEQSGA